MSGSLDKSSAKSLSVQTIVLAEAAWALAALLFFLVFSVRLPGQAQPVWYSLGTSIFEIVAFFVAAYLCLRNFRSPQIVSGRNVWLGIGLGMLFYGIGSVLFTWWETGLGRDAAVSPGDFLYIPAYVCIVVGMLLAVRSRRLNLAPWQWLVLVVIAVLGTVCALWLSTRPAPNCPTQGQQPIFSEPISLIAPANAQVSPVTIASAQVTQAPALNPASQIAAQPNKPTAPNPTAAPTPTAAPVEDAPAWVTAIEGPLAQLEGIVGVIYIIADVALLIMATALLLAFWGGRFVLSWRMIAAAAFSYYIADLWFLWANNNLCDYQSGSLPEVFWIFSPVLFGIGAALEYDLSSSRSRRAGGRRRA
jgi:hypothetical protein